MRFSGSTAECLVDFGQRYPDGRKLLARFAQVSEHQTARAWVSGKQSPVGEPLMRVRCFLFLAGYKVREFEELPKLTKQLALLISTKVVKLDDVQSDLDYKTRDPILDIVLRGTSPMRDKGFRLERLVGAYRDELDREIDSWKDEIAQLMVAEQAPPSAAEKPAVDVPVRDVVDSTVTRVPELSENVVLSGTHRRRDRSQRKIDDEPVVSVKALTHILFALDDVLSDLDDKVVAAVMIKERVSPKRLRAIKRFLDQALKE